MKKYLPNKNLLLPASNASPQLAKAHEAIDWPTDDFYSKITVDLQNSIRITSLRREKLC